MEHKFILCEKMESDDESGTIVGWGSKPTIDRDKELIEPNAWQLENYRKNPVLLLCHNYSVPPIGKCLWVKPTSQGLRFKAKFANTDRGKECYELYKDGIMSAFSVGFKPLPGGVIDNPSDVKYKGVKRVFTNVELMEISCVPVPAHSDALVDHVKSGKIHTKQLKEELEMVLEIVDKSDDQLELEMKITDVEIKIEETEDFVHIPNPDGKGDHKDCKIRTISISKKEGIQAHYCVDDKVVTSYIFDKKKWDKEKALKWVEDHKKFLLFEVPEIETEPIAIQSKDAFWDENGDIAFKDASSQDSVEKGLIPLDAQNNPSVFKIQTAIELALNKDYKPSEPTSKINCQYWVRELFPLTYPLGGFAILNGCFGSGNDLVKVDYTYDPKTQTAVLMNKVNVDQVYMTLDSKKEVEDFLRKIFPDKTLEIKSPEELLAAIDKSAEIDDLKETIKAMEEQMDAKVQEFIGKTVDAEGMPSLYDLTSAVNNALNLERYSNIQSDRPSDVPSKNIVDIFSTEYPSGHVVYSQFDKNTRSTKYYRVDYDYDLLTRTAIVSGMAEEVLLSWIQERYLTEVEEKELGDDLDIKTGKVLSAKNKKIISDCMAKMIEAHAAMDEMMKMSEAEKGEGDLNNKANDSVEEFQLVEDHNAIVELTEKEVENKNDELIEIDEEVLQGVVTKTLMSSPQKLDMKGITEEVIAKLRGRATL